MFPRAFHYCNKTKSGLRKKNPPSFLFLLLLSHLAFRGRPHSALHYSKAPLAATWKGKKFPVGYSIALHHGNGTQIATKIYALHALLHNSSFSKFFFEDLWLQVLKKCANSREKQSCRGNNWHGKRRRWKKRSEVDLRLKNMLHEKYCRNFFTLAARVKQK